MKKTRDLFWTFLKIGAFTFGGGYAMVALLEREFVEDKQWLSRDCGVHAGPCGGEQRHLCGL